MRMYTRKSTFERATARALTLVLVGLTLLVPSGLLCPAPALAEGEEILTAQDGEGDFDGNVWFEQDGLPETLYSDGSLTLRLNTEGTIEDPYRILVNVGSWDGWPGDAGFDFDARFTEDAGAYTYDADAGEIVLDGSWLFEHGYDHVQAFCTIARDPGAGEPLEVLESTGDGLWLNVREASIHYDFEDWSDRFHNPTLLVGDSFSVPNDGELYVEDSAHPDGATLEYEVTDVAIDPEDHPCLEVTGTEQGIPTHFQANELGSATLTITYRVPELDDLEGSYAIQVNVTDEAYELRFSGDDDYECLPGDTVRVSAEVRRRTPTGTENATDSFEFTCETLEDAEFVQIEQDDEQFTLQFTDGGTGDNLQPTDVKLAITATYGNVNLTRQIWYRVTPWLVKLQPAGIGGLEPGESSEPFTPSYECRGIDGSRVTLTSLTWDYDHNNFEVTYEDGTVVDDGQAIEDIDPIPSFVITRKSADEGMLTLTAAYRIDDNSQQESIWREYWFGDAHYDLELWLDDNEEGYHDWCQGNLYSDGTRTLRVCHDGRIPAGYQLYVSVGPWDCFPGDADFRWEDAFTEGEAYTFDEQSGEVVLDGAWLYDTLGADQRVTIFAAVTDGGDNVIANADPICFWTRRAGDLFEFHRRESHDMLFGWNWDIQKEGWGDNYYRTADAAHPDGIDGSYVVTDVTCTEQPNEGFEHVIDLRDEGNRWQYEAVGYGTAKLTVSYQLEDGTTGSYDFDVTVTDDFYNLWIDVARGNDWGKPGETIDLVAWGSHDFNAIDENGWRHTEESDEGLSVVFSLAGPEAEEFAELDDHGDGTAAVTLKDYDGDGNRDFRVQAKLLYDQDGDGTPEEHAQQDIVLTVCRAYVCFEPYRSDVPNLAVGESYVMPLRLWERTTEGDHNLTDQATFELEYDSRTIEVGLEPNGTTITLEPADENNPDGTQMRLTIAGSLAEEGALGIPLKRLNNWQTNLNVWATWEDEDGESRDHAGNWEFNDQNYELWFERNGNRTDRETVYNDGNLTLSLGGSEAVRQSLEAADSPVTLEWHIGFNNYDEATDTNTWLGNLDEHCYGYDVATGALTIYGDKAWADPDVQLNHGVNVHVTLCADDGDETEQLCDCWCWVEMREANLTYDLPADDELQIGWWRRINRWSHVWGENGAHPWWVDDDFEITQVAVDGTDVIVLGTQNGDDSRSFQALGDGVTTASFESLGEDELYLQAVGNGVAQVTLTYRDLDGQEREHRYAVSVQDEIYELWTWNEGSNSALPGGSVALCAGGRHRFLVPGDGEGDNGHFEESYDDVSFRWSLTDEDARWATISDHGDGTATLTFLDPPENVNPRNFSMSVRPVVELLDAAGTVQKTSSCDAWVSGEYEDLVVLDAETGEELYGDVPIDLFGSRTLRPEIRHFVYGEEGYTLSTDLVCRWFIEGEEGDGSTSFGNDKLTMEAEGDGYTFTWHKNRRTNVHLNVEYLNAWGDPDHRDWDFAVSDNDYRARVPWFRYYVHPDQTVRVAVDRSAVTAMGSAAETQIKIGVGDWGENGWIQFDDMLVEGRDYTIDQSDENTWYVNVTGAALFYKGWNNVHVSAETVLRYGDGDEDHYFEAADVEVNGSASLENTTIALERTSYTYDGKAKVPGVTVTWDGADRTLLQEGVDYQVAYASNKNAGTAKVTISGLAFAGEVTKTFAINKAANPLALANSTQVYLTKTVKSKAQTVAPKVSKKGQGTVTYTNGKANSKTKGWKVDKKTGKVTVPKGTKKGTYTVKVKAVASGNGNYKAGTKYATITVKIVDKYDQTLTVKAKAPSTTAAKTKKAAQSIAMKNVLAVSKAQGKVTYKKAGGSGNLSIDKKNNVVVKKGTKKGTYSIKIKVSAAGNANYKAGSKTVTVKVTVK